MIAIQLQGQLGNQLFQIAFIRNVASELKEIPVILNDPAYGCQPEKYFRIRLTEKRFFRKALKKIFLLKKRTPLEFSNWQGSDEVMRSLKPGVTYIGFFQSEDYFSDHFKKNPFRIKRKYRLTFKEKYGAILKNSSLLVVHIRLTDYCEAGGESIGGKGLNLPLNYYQDAIESFSGRVNLRVIVISDDPEYVRRNLVTSVPYNVEYNDAVTDLQLLMNADHLVLSNSSFSWWGAYLNRKPGLEVIAPEHWLGFKVGKTYPVGIFLPSWKITPVNTQV
jgi:hypothetical protein